MSDDLRQKIANGVTAWLEQETTEVREAMGKGEVIALVNSICSQFTEADLQ